MTALGREQMVVPGHAGNDGSEGRRARRVRGVNLGGQHFLGDGFFFSQNPGQVIAAHQVKSFQKEKADHQPRSENQADIRLLSSSTR